MARAFVSEVRRDLERAAVMGADLPPRIRTMHTRAGHATPEYRTLALPVEQGEASPDAMSHLIARWARLKPACSILLALDAVAPDPDGQTRPVLIAEARDRWGTRLFWMQGFRVVDTRVVWEEPLGGGWQDPGGEELILDEAFESAPALPVPRRRALEPAPVAE